MFDGYLGNLFVYMLIGATMAFGGAMHYKGKREERERSSAYKNALQRDICALYAKAAHHPFAESLAKRALEWYDRGAYTEAETLARVCAVELAERGVFVMMTLENFAA